jgi:hypothetical protein
MMRRMNHLLIFGSVAIVAWIVGSLLLIYFWPHLINNIYQKAILNQGFGDGPIPVNTLYVEPQSLFADPLHPPASASTLAVTGVNRDTLLVVGSLDLSKGPLVLQVPDFSDRYYSVQFTDPFNVDFAYVGTRETGTAAGEYLITGPDWKGSVPQGMKQVPSQNNAVLVVGRILVYSDSDLSTAYALATQIKLAPLK